MESLLFRSRKWRMLVPVKVLSAAECKFPSARMSATEAIHTRKSIRRANFQASFMERLSSDFY